ncbi:MAG: hypothetical protein ACRDQW_19020 [Haloechinothrix sp.]
MADVSKKLVIGSMAAAGLVAVAAIMDIALKIPFAGRTVMDIMFLVGSAVVLYMGWDTYQEMK